MKHEILDLIILGGYSFEEIAEIFEITINEVKRIYINALD